MHTSLPGILTGAWWRGMPLLINPPNSLTTEVFVKANEYLMSAYLGESTNGVLNPVCGLTGHQIRFRYIQPSTKAEKRKGPLGRRMVKLLEKGKVNPQSLKVQLRTVGEGEDVKYKHILFWGNQPVMELRGLLPHVDPSASENLVSRITNHVAGFTGLDQVNGFKSELVRLYGNRLEQMPATLAKVIRQVVIDAEKRLATQ